MLLPIPQETLCCSPNEGSPNEAQLPSLTDESLPVLILLRNHNYTAKPRASALAVISLFVGFLSFVGWAVTEIPLPALGAIAVILGLLALRAIRRNPARLEGKGVAWTGVAGGFLNLLVVLAFTWFSSQPQTFG